MEYWCVNTQHPQYRFRKAFLGKPVLQIQRHFQGYDSQHEYILPDSILVWEDATMEEAYTALQTLMEG